MSASFFKTYLQSTLGIKGSVGKDASASSLPPLATRLQAAWGGPSATRLERTFLRFSTTAKQSQIDAVLKDFQRDNIDLFAENSKWSRGRSFWTKTTDCKSTVKQLKRKHPRVFYLQSFSSAIPVHWLSDDIRRALDEGKDVKIADFCASPGSKTIQLVEQLSLSSTSKSMHAYSSSSVFASEINPKRFKNLQQYMSESLNLQSLSLLKISKRDASMPLKKQRNFFDFILLDAPCSGEGLIDATVPKTFKGWSLEIVARNVNLQRRLLDAAVRQLKPGGVMIYSTCTLNPYENEEQVAYVLEKYPYMRLELMPEDFSCNLVDKNVAAHEVAPFLSGMSFGKFDLENCLRILPSSLYEGFFVAKLRKMKSD